mgnify:CR=1 FL=1|jgi:hypothetical protein
MWIKVIAWGVFFLLMGIFLLHHSASLEALSEEERAKVYDFGFGSGIIFLQSPQGILDIGKPMGYLVSALGIIVIVVGIKFPDRWK